MDQAGDHAAAPRALVHVAFHHDRGIDARHFFDDVLEGDRIAERLFLGDQALDRRIGQHAFGVAQRAHDEAGVEFGRGKDRLLHVLVHRRFLGGDEAGAHVHPLRAHRQAGDKAAPVGHAAAGDEGNVQLVRRAREQDEVRHIILARMAAAFETVDAHRIAADLLRLEAVAHRGALVDHLDPGVLQRRQQIDRVAPRRLDHLHPAVDDRLDQPGIVGRGQGRQDGEVHAEGLVGHVLAARDLVGELFGRALRQAGDDPEPARIGDGGGHLGKADIVHPALDDGVLDPEHFGDGGLHGVSSPVKTAFGGDTSGFAAGFQVRF